MIDNASEQYGAQVEFNKFWESPIRQIHFMMLVMCLLASCTEKPCQTGPSAKEVFDLKIRCNELGAKLDETYAGQFDSPEGFKVNLLHHVYLSHYKPSQNTCYVFLNRTYPDCFKEYVVDATNNKEILQSTSPSGTMNSVYHWYDNSNHGMFFQVNQERYLAKFKDLMEIP